MQPVRPSSFEAAERFLALHFLRHGDPKLETPTERIRESLRQHLAECEWRVQYQEPFQVYWHRTPGEEPAGKLLVLEALNTWLHGLLNSDAETLHLHVALTRLEEGEVSISVFGTLF